ncbi:unnamed protein product [Amoebophrya sp. A25]|nr:unnamed protein product [Amoebophrya sp. A25]|eukprot:GSA25T00017718001.1
MSSDARLPPLGGVLGNDFGTSPTGATPTSYAQAPAASQGALDSFYGYNTASRSNNTSPILTGPGVERYSISTQHDVQQFNNVGTSESVAGSMPTGTAPGTTQSLLGAPQRRASASSASSPYMSAPGTAQNLLAAPPPGGSSGPSASQQQQAASSATANTSAKNIGGRSVGGTSSSTQPNLVVPTTPEPAVATRPSTMTTLGERFSQLFGGYGAGGAGYAASSPSVAEELPTDPNVIQAAESSSRNAEPLELRILAVAGFDSKQGLLGHAKYRVAAYGIPNEGKTDPVFLSSTQAKPGDDLTFFGDTLDVTGGFRTLIVKFEEEGFFGAYNATAETRLAMSDVTLGVARTETMVDAELLKDTQGEPQPGKSGIQIRFVVQNKPTGTQGEPGLAGKSVVSALPTIESTILAPASPLVPILDVQSIEDIPDLLPNTPPDRTKAIDVRVLDSATNSVVEKIGPFATSPSGPSSLSLRRADIKTRLALRRVGLKVDSTGGGPFVSLRLQIVYLDFASGTGAESIVGVSDEFQVSKVSESHALKLIGGRGSISLYTVMSSAGETSSATPGVDTTLLPTNLTTMAPAAGATAASAVGMMGQGGICMVGQGAPRKQAPANITREHTMLLAATGQERALQKAIEGRKKIDLSNLDEDAGGYFRTWGSLDDLFGSLGVHPMTQSEVYTHLVVRSQPTEISGVSHETRVHVGNIRLGLSVQRGVDWEYGDQDTKAPPAAATNLQSSASASRTGIVTAVDEVSKLCSVVWESNPMDFYSHYRIGRHGKYDLSLVTSTAHAPAPLVCQPLGQRLRQHELTEYVPRKQIVNPEQHETLKYAVYNKQQDPKVSFLDAHPEYRIKEDIWGRLRAKKAGYGHDAQAFEGHNIFVQTCVRHESIWA